MSTYIDVVGVDTSTGGIANDSLVTLDGSGNYLYHIPANIVFSGKLFITQNGSLTRGADEEGNMGGQGDREYCTDFDWDGNFDTGVQNVNNLNESSGHMGFLEVIEDRGNNHIELDSAQLCSDIRLLQGGMISAGGTATVMYGNSGGGVHQYPPMRFGDSTSSADDGGRIYMPWEDANDDEVQDTTRFNYFSNICKNGTDAIHADTMASKIEWFGIDNVIGDPVGQSIWMKGEDLSNADTFNGGTTDETMIGLSIVTEGTSATDSNGIRVDVKNGGYSFFGQSDSAIMLNKAAIRAGHSASEYLEIDHSGSNGIINCTHDTLSFRMGGSEKANLNTSGDFQVKGDLHTAWTSDERLKANITNIDNALDKINKINGVNFDWNHPTSELHTGKDIGVIAQEIEAIAPEAVVTRENGYKAVKYEKLVPVLIEAVKELSNTVVKLEEKIEDLSSSNRSTSF
tara:strand:+ start:795 stop:2165 length:1371 start_codon:yes stop_codon:yes gene_type:complete